MKEDKLVHKPIHSTVNHLPKSVKDVFSKEEILKSIYIKKIRDKWSELIGPLLGDNSYPKDYTNDTLQILTSHSAYSQEIMFQNQVILKYLQEDLKLKSIKNLRCSIGSFPKKKKKRVDKKIGTLDGKEHLLELVDQSLEENLKKNLIELIKLMD